MATGFSPGDGRTGLVSKEIGGLTSWSVQLDSPGTALTVGGSGLGVKTRWDREAAVLTQPLQ